MDYIAQGIAEAEQWLRDVHWCPGCPDHDDPPDRPAAEVLAEHGRGAALPDGMRVRLARG